MSNDEREVTCHYPVSEPPNAEGHDAVECGEPVPLEAQVCLEHMEEQLAWLIEENGQLTVYAVQQDVVVAYLLTQLGGMVRIPPLEEVDVPENVGVSVDVDGSMTLRVSSAALPNT